MNTSAPIITGATLKVLLKPSDLHQMTEVPWLYAAGILAAFVSGYWAIKFMLQYLSKHGLGVFAAYRIAVGIFILVIGLMHVPDKSHMQGARHGDEVY